MMKKSAPEDMSPTNTISCMSTITFSDTSSTVVFNMSNFEESTRSQFIHGTDFDEFSVTGKDENINAYTNLQDEFNGTVKEDLSDKLTDVIDITSEKNVSKGNGSLYSRLMRKFITDKVQHDSVEAEQTFLKNYHIDASPIKNKYNSRNKQTTPEIRNELNQSTEKNKIDLFCPRKNKARASDIRNDIPKENSLLMDKEANLSPKETLQDQSHSKSRDIYEKKLEDKFDSSTNSSTSEKKDLSRQWRKVEDDVTGKVYYYNRKTRKSQWNTPEDAIILPRKRRHFPTFTTSKSIIPGTCSSIISSIHTRVDFEDSIQSDSVYSVDNHMIKYDSSIEIDEEAREDTSQHCSQPRDIVILSPKESSHNHSNVETIDLSVNEDSVQSQCTGDAYPQNTQENTTTEKVAILPILYCLYCGEGFKPPAQLILHLNDCVNYAMVQKSNPRIVEFIKKSLVIPLKKDSDSLKDCSLESSAIKKEKNDVLNSSSVTAFCLGQKKKREIDFRKGPDDAELQHTAKKAWELELNHQDFLEKSHCNPQLHDESSPGGYSDSDRDDDEYKTSPICSKCPFCKRSFGKGNQLSSHLLKCQERKRAKKRRKSSNLHTKHTIQSLLTGGGRHLPGYPKLSKQTHSD